MYFRTIHFSCMLCWRYGCCSDNFLEQNLNLFGRLRLTSVSESHFLRQNCKICPLAPATPTVFLPSFPQLRPPVFTTVCTYSIYCQTKSIFQKKKMLFPHHITHLIMELASARSAPNLHVYHFSGDIEQMTQVN